MVPGMKHVVLTALTLLLLAGCRKQDLRTVTIRVPAMHNAACTNVVVEALVRVQSIPRDWIRADAEHGTVTVTYDSMQRSLRNLEFAIADAGFQANDTPASRQAATNLPPECR
jgi:copper chaperone CopZ